MASLLNVVRSFTKGSFYTMVPSRIAASIQLWKTQLPTVTPFYAVKCNPDKRLLRHLHAANINFDCASERELTEVKEFTRANFASKVIYANPCKSSRDIEAAKRMGSPMTVVDSVEEVEKLAEHSYSGGVLLRIAVDDSKSEMPFSSKFGALATTVERIARKAYQAAIQIHGFSFHVGSGSKDTLSFANAMKQALASESLLQVHGHTPKILDIGGGFLPNADDFRAKAFHIRGIIESAHDYTIWAEPGRFFATDAFDFYVQVIGKKPAFNRHGIQTGWRYTIDDSIYGQFTNILFDKAKPKWLRVTEAGEKPRNFTQGTLFGRTCDSMDRIADSDYMEELEVGDWLWFPRMGAYTRATASEFNGFPTPDVHILEPYIHIDPTIDPSNPFLAQNVQYNLV